MDDRTEKKRLRLLNEVLPAPTRAGGAGPRERTVQHMNRLLAAAASAAILSCSQKPVGGETSGYGVVDPMPPPSRCPGTAGAITAEAKWIEGNLIEVTVLVKPGNPGVKLGKVESWYGKVLATEGSGVTEPMKVRYEPQAGDGAATLNLVIEVQCPDSAHVQIGASVPRQAPGSSFAVNIVDSF